MIIVGKHINDITLNDLEYLLDENGDIMEFESEKKAIQFLKSFGFDDEQIYYFKFIEKEPASAATDTSSSDEKNIQFNYKRLRRSCQC